MRSRIFLFPFVANFLVELQRTRNGNRAPNCLVTFTELILIANVIKCRQTVNVEDYEYGDVLTVPKFIGKTVPIRD